MGPTMYTYIMVRTQIYITEAMAEVLRRLSEETGLTRSELIRQALEAAYLDTRDPDVVVRGLEAAAGAWASEGSGASYAERLRRGRLASLYAADAE